MSLKDNFNQAVKEILKKDGLVGDDLSKESKKKSELDRYIDPPRQQAESAPEPVQETTDEPEIPEVPEFQAQPEPAPEPEPEPVSSFSENPYVRTAQSAADFGARPASQPFTPDPFGMGSRSSRTGEFGSSPSAMGGMGGMNSPSSSGFGGGGMPPRAGNTPPYRGGSDTPYYETEETTVISRNTIIDGNIRSFANINIDGSVKGDVKITKNINISGKVVGDIECNNSVMSGASMEGNITSKGQVQLDRDSILIGDIAAQYVDMNGKMKGNLDVGGKAEFKTDAVILGNITASTITVLDGATIQGYVNTTFLQESTANIFPESIAITE